MFGGYQRLGIGLARDGTKRLNPHNDLIPIVAEGWLSPVSDIMTGPVGDRDPHQVSPLFTAGNL